MAIPRTRRSVVAVVAAAGLFAGGCADDRAATDQTGVRPPAETLPTLPPAEMLPEQPTPVPPVDATESAGSVVDITVTDVTGYRWGDLAGVVTRDIDGLVVGGFASRIDDDPFTTTVRLLRPLMTDDPFWPWPPVTDEEAVLAPGRYVLTLWVDTGLGGYTRWYPLNSDGQGLAGCVQEFRVDDGDVTEVVLDADVRSTGYFGVCEPRNPFYDDAPIAAPWPDFEPVAVFTIADGLATDRIGGVDVGVDGTVWATSEHGPVTASAWPWHESYAWFDGERFVDVGAPDRSALDGSNDPGVYGMDATGGPDGTLWVATTGFDSTGDAYLYDGASWSSPIRGTLLDLIRGRAAPDGSLWMISMGGATVDENDDIRGIGLTRVDPNGTTPLPVPDGGIPCGFCAEYEFDNDGAAWMWTEHGLFRLDGAGWTPVIVDLPETPGPGLAPAGVRWALGADGSHWFITEAGSDATEEYLLVRLDDDGVTSLPVPTAQPVVDRACMADWLGVDVESVTDEAIADSASLSAAYVDHAGDADGMVWVALRCSGVYAIDVETGEIVRYAREDGLPSLDLRDLDSHPDGSVWVATSRGVVRIDDESSG